MQIFLHISKILRTFVAEFTPEPCFTVEGGGFFTY